MRDRTEPTFDNMIVIHRPAEVGGEQWAVMVAQLRAFWAQELAGLTYESATAR